MLSFKDFEHINHCVFCDRTLIHTGAWMVFDNKTVIGCPEGKNHVCSKTDNSFVISTKMGSFATYTDYSSKIHIPQIILFNSRDTKIDISNWTVDDVLDFFKNDFIIS